MGRAADIRECYGQNRRGESIVGRFAHLVVGDYGDAVSGDDEIIPFLCLCRVVMGLGEGASAAVMNNVASRWVPKFERSRAVSICMGGFQSGSMIGLLVVPLLMSKFGIAGPFYVFGTITLSSGVECRATSYPQERKSRKGGVELSKTAGRLLIVAIVGGEVTVVAEKETPWKMLLSHPATWGAPCISSTFGFFILLA